MKKVINFIESGLSDWLNEVLDVIYRHGDVALINAIYSIVYTGVVRYEWNIKFGIYNQSVMLLDLMILLGVFWHFKFRDVNRESDVDFVMNVVFVFIGTKFVGEIMCAPLLLIPIISTYMFDGYVCDIIFFTITSLSIFLGITPFASRSR